MFFADVEHMENYELLMERYRLVPAQDVQYEATIYVAGLPEIYKAINLDDLEETSPLYTLTSWNDEEEKYVFNAAELTGSSRRICEFSLSLYNGYEVGLDDILGSVASDNLVQVLFQSMKIRANIREKSI